ncbi:hypothetical protein H920_12869 [Fukomys damarensis]|uniref:Uncharacterized protein n=1 Tax=Fukomys damarensis TaxID=885580 RepID=A0A091D5J9_FUKDA|nr:hypothetical protein H920_12869 [Fukomys damarensis]
MSIIALRPPGVSLLQQGQGAATACDRGCRPPAGPQAGAQLALEELDLTPAQVPMLLCAPSCHTVTPRAIPSCCVSDPASQEPSRLGSGLRQATLEMQLEKRGWHRAMEGQALAATRERLPVYPLEPRSSSWNSPSLEAPTTWLRVPGGLHNPTWPGSQNSIRRLGLLPTPSRKAPQLDPGQQPQGTLKKGGLQEVPS